MTDETGYLVSCPTCFNEYDFPTLREADAFEKKIGDRQRIAKDVIPRRVLLRELQDARDVSIRPTGGEPLKAWNYVVDHLERFVQDWPFAKRSRR